MSGHTPWSEIKERRAALDRLAREVDRTIRLGGWSNFEHSVHYDPDAAEWVIGFRLEGGAYSAEGLEVEIRARSDDHALGQLHARLHAIGRPDQ